MEVECKLRIDAGELDGLRERLVAAGARMARKSRQVDTYFHHPARDLSGADEAFRLREDGGFELTYKGPRQRHDFKAREEFNVPTAVDPRPLAALGFQAAARLVKEREAWVMDGCEVALDHVDGLGWFVEVEAHADDPSAAIEDTLQRLDLTGRPMVSQSYLGLALDQGASAVERLS